MKRNLLIITAVVILVSALLAISLTQWFSLSANQPYSAENPDPTGIKALRLLLEERGVKTELWHDEYDHLPEQAGHTLMIVQPQTDPPSPEMKESLMRWVRRGNQVILWASPGSSWGKSFQLESRKCGSSSLFVTVIERADNPWFREIQQLKWPGGECLKKDSSRRSLLADHAGETLAAEQPEGAGRLVFVPEPEIIFNRSIDSGENLAVPLGLIEGWKGTVFFDESVRSLMPILVQDASDESSAQDEEWAAEPPLKLRADVWLVIVQLFLLTLLWLYARGKRFGAPRLERARKKREGKRQVDAMARWFMRVGGRREALLRGQGRLRRELASVLRLPEKVAEQELLEQVELRLGKDYRDDFQELSRMICQIAAEKRNLSADAMIRLYTELIRLRKELAEWKTKPRITDASKP